MKRFYMFLTFSGCSLVLMGCVELIALGTYTGIEQFYSYSSKNIVHKTFTREFDDVFNASKAALEKMKFKIGKIDVKDKKTRICASAPSLDIEVYMCSITSNTTRVSVNTSNKKLQKDKATAAEVVAQIDLTLWAKESAMENVGTERTYKHEIPLIYLEQDFDP